jgi:hypothetical protein
MAVGRAIGEAATRAGVGCAGDALAGVQTHSSGVAGKGEGDEDELESGWGLGSVEARVLKRSGRRRSESGSVNGGVGGRGAGVLRRMRVAGEHWIQERGEECRCCGLFAVVGEREAVFGCGLGRGSRCGFGLIHSCCLASARPN